MGVFTFNGTNGKEVTVEKPINVFGTTSVMRLYVSHNGLNLKNMHMKFNKPFDADFWEKLTDKNKTDI